MAKHALVTRFVALVDGWNAAGWGEYLLWETLEGSRDRPFRLLPPLPPDDLEMCRGLRDDIKQWPFWDTATQSWQTTGIKAWRLHTQEVKADDVRTAWERKNEDAPQR